MYLQKMVSIFHKDYLETSTVTSAFLDSTPLMAKLTIKLFTKRKQGQPVKGATKRVKWDNNQVSSIFNGARSWQMKDFFIDNIYTTP